MGWFLNFLKKLTERNGKDLHSLNDNYDNKEISEENNYTYW